MLSAHQELLTEPVPYLENVCLLKKLPSIAFSLIKTFVEHQNYLNLMKTGKLFKNIKFETVQLVFEIIQDSESIELLEEKFQKFDKIRQKYNYLGRRDQLKLILKNISNKMILFQNASYYKNIYDIEVQYVGDDLTLVFDFSIFNNIQKVSLEGFHRVQYIHNGFENIQTLIIRSFPDLRFVDCPLIDLDYLQIKDCPNLESLSYLHNIKRINFHACPHLYVDLSGLKKSLQTLAYSPIHQSIKLKDIPFHSLQRLFLFDYHSVPDDDMKVLSHLSTCTFTNNSSIFIPEFPSIFYGKMLTMSYCGLSSWIHQPCPNLDFLLLSSCTGLIQLPIFPKLRDLTLLSMGDLEEIRSESLPNCHDLCVSNCERIRWIYQLPKIRKMEVDRCDNFEGFIGFDDPGDLKSMKLKSLPVFHNIASIRNIPEVNIISCWNIFTFNGFDQSNLLRNDRKVILEDFDANDCNLEGLGNIGILELNGVANLEDGKGIHDIDHLIIHDAPMLTRFTNFHRIQSFEIYDGTDLVSLDGLQSVSEVYLLFSRTETNTNDVHDVNDAEVTDGPVDDNAGHDVVDVQIQEEDDLSPHGLQGCGRVFCSGDLFIAREAQKYVNDRNSTEFADIFATINEFHIISPSSNERIRRLWPNSSSLPENNNCQIRNLPTRALSLLWEYLTTDDAFRLRNSSRSLFQNITLDPPSTDA